MNSSVPLIGCHCPACDKVRADNAQAERSRTYSFDFEMPDMSGFAKAAEAFGQIGRMYAPFEPEPPADPFYTHVLLDFDADGNPMPGYAELHTAESLIDAMVARNDQDERYSVFELGQLSFTVKSV
jgi:hypothetical protein